MSIDLSSHFFPQAQRAFQARLENSSTQCLTPQCLTPTSCHHIHSAPLQAVSIYRRTPNSTNMTETVKTDQSARMAIVLVFLALALVFACVQASISYHKKRRYSKLHGCQVPPLENPYDFLGFSKIIRSTKTFLAKESLNSTVKLFQQHGNTYTTRVLTSKVIFTCDPVCIYSHINYHQSRSKLTDRPETWELSRAGTLLEDIVRLALEQSPGYENYLSPILYITVLIH